MENMNTLYNMFSGYSEKKTISIYIIILDRAKIFCNFEYFTFFKWKAGPFSETLESKAPINIRFRERNT